MIWTPILSDYNDTICTKLQVRKCQITNPLSSQNFWDTNCTTPFQFENNLLGESCPPNALRPLLRPPTPASQYLSQNKTIQWLLSTLSLPFPTVSYRDCQVRMHSVECNIVHVRFGVDVDLIRFWEKRFSWHNPSLDRRDRDGGEQTTNLDKTESPSKVFMCGVSTQQWPSTQITLFERTRQSAWLDAVTTLLTRSDWILVY